MKCFYYHCKIMLLFMRNMTFMTFLVGDYIYDYCKVRIFTRFNL